VPGDIYKVSRVDDAFGRSAVFTYNAAGQLVSITDVIGLQSQFGYASGDILNSLTTPYGTTSFSRGQSSPVDRWIEVTDPLGGKERAESKEQASGVPFEEAFECVFASCKSGVTTTEYLYVCDGLQISEKRDSAVPSFPVAIYYPQGERKFLSGTYVNYSYLRDRLGSVREPQARPDPSSRTWIICPTARRPRSSPQLQMPTSVLPAISSVPSPA
jgi:YD repeat-containing protein